MFANPDGRKSVDSLSPMTPHTHRSDFPFHRQGSATGFPRQRRESVASSIHSIGGSLDTVPGSWASAVLESGQNAISTLLQPPIVRTGLLPHTSAPASSAHKPPTAKDIPPVALTNIPHVEAAEFAPYLTQVGALYEQLRRAKENDEESTDGSQRRGSKPEDVADLLDDGHLKPGRRPSSTRKASISSISSLSALEMPGPLRRSSSSFIRKTTQGPPPLSTIPNVYFDDDFHLENPRTFDIVSERSEVVRPTPGSTEEKQAANGRATAPRKALATNAILQEKLSWYMDTVEMHLISSISTASSTFFTALGSLKELHTEAAESVEKIRALRTELENLDDEIATRGLDIVQRRRKRENLQQLHDAILQLRAIIEKVAVCESLVDEGELEKALDDVDSLERLIAGEVDAPVVLGQKTLQRPRVRDLRGATALQGVNEDIETLRFRVGKAYEAKLVTALMADVRRHVDNVSSREVLMRWSSASLRARGGHAREPSTFPSYLTATDDLRSELTPILHGLHRSRYLGQATVSYRESLLREIRNLIKRPLPSSNDDDNESMMSSSTTGRGQRSQQDKGSILARNLRALEPEDAEELLVKVYIGVTETLRRLSTQAKVLLDVASSIGEDSEPEGLRSPQIRSPPISPGGRRMSIAAIEAQEELHKALDLSNLVGQAVDVAQDRVVRLLRARAEQSTHLSLIWFLRYFTLNLHFANECEAISGRSGTTLKNVVNGHIRGFVQQHGDTEKQKLAQGMESDQWDAKDFDEKHTELLGRVLKSSTKDDETWSDGTKVWIPYSDVDSGNDENDENDEPDDPAQPNGTAKAKARGAVIEEETFLLPNSAILCLDGLSQFLRLMVSMPSMTPDISVSLISYLQLFNSRCTQLILGAGATRSAGLRNITTKHLALASQALGFIVTLVPHIRELARRHAGAGPPVANLMGEFDKVKRGYQEHQNNIYDKLVEIMSGRAVAHSKAMKTITWDKPEPAAHPYMNTLVKETSMLQRNLTKTLPEHRVLMIMVPVFNSYKEQFGKAFQTAEVDTEAGRQSMLQDVDFFISKLGKVDGFGDTGDYLKTIINSREIVAPAPAPDPAPAPAAKESPAASPAGSARPSGEGDQAPAETTTTPDETKEEEKGEATDTPKDG